MEWRRRARVREDRGPCELTEAAAGDMTALKLWRGKCQGSRSASNTRRGRGGKRGSVERPVIADPSPATRFDVNVGGGNLQGRQRGATGDSTRSGVPPAGV
jgi:hypothetical protein